MSDLRRLERPDAPALAWALHRPAGKAHGAAFLVHGYKDHSSRYLHVVERWVERGLIVGRFDLRGHGHSEGKRGDIRHFDDYLRDALDVLVALAADDAWRVLDPPVVFGHSAGALVAMELAWRQRSRVRALALSSPYLALAMKAPAWKVSLGRVLSGVLPSFGLDAGLTVDLQTSCPEMQQQILADPLRFPEARARWFTETLRIQRELAQRASAIDLPVLCLAAGADRIADIEATRRVVGRMPNAELRVLPDHQHEVLHEVERATNIEAFADWIESRCAIG